MNIDDFQRAIVAAKIPPAAYSISDADHFENYGIGPRSNGWELYYSERGERRAIAYLDNESEALDALYKKLIEGFSRNFPSTQSEDGKEYHLFRCTGCHRKLRVPFQQSAILVRCPDCRAEFTIKLLTYS